MAELVFLSFSPFLWPLPLPPRPLLQCLLKSLSSNQPRPQLTSWPIPSQERMQFCAQGAHKQRENTATPHSKTYLLASHGLKHFLQLDPQLLHVVHQDAWLWGQMELLSLGFFRHRTHQPRVSPPLTLLQKPQGIYITYNIYMSP